MEYKIIIKIIRTHTLLVEKIIALTNKYSISIASMITFSFFFQQYPVSDQASLNMEILYSPVSICQQYFKFLPSFDSVKEPWNPFTAAPDREREKGDHMGYTFNQDQKGMCYFHLYSIGLELNFIAPESKIVIRSQTCQTEKRDKDLKSSQSLPLHACLAAKYPLH